MKEVRQRFDFKDSKARARFGRQRSGAYRRRRNQTAKHERHSPAKLVRRGVPLKALSYGNPEPAAGGTVRQRAAIQQGIPQEKAKRLCDSSRIRKPRSRLRSGRDVRISGKDRDTCSK